MNESKLMERIRECRGADGSIVITHGLGEQVIFPRAIRGDGRLQYSDRENRILAIEIKRIKAVRPRPPQSWTTL